MILQCSPFITLCLGSIGIECVISESYYKGTILQMNYRKMTISWSFSYDAFVKFYGKTFWEPHDGFISKSGDKNSSCPLVITSEI